MAEFFAKSLHIILESRIPDIHSKHLFSGDESSTSSTRGSTNTWFNMELDTCAAAAEAAEPWRRSGLGEPMVVDVHVHQPQARDGLSPTSPSGTSFQEAALSESGRGSSGTLLERWVVQYDRQDRRRRQGSASELSLRDEAAGFGSGSGRSDGRVAISASRGEVMAGFSRAGGLAGARTGPQGSGSGMAAKGAVEVPLVYKRAVIMLRTLYCTARTLPAYRLFRLAKNSSLSRNFTLAFCVSASPPDLTQSDEASMTPYSFAPIDTPDGRMCVSVAYRHTSTVTAAEITPSIAPKIISDYVGSPTTDPLRRFSSSPHTGSAPNVGVSKRRGVPAVSLPSSPSGAALGRRHSWSGAANKASGSSLPSPTVRNNSKSPSPVHPSDAFPSPSSPHPPSPRPASSPLGPGMSPRSSPSHPLFARHYPSQPSSLHQTSQPIPVKGRQCSPGSTPSPSPSPPNPSLPHNSRHCSAPVSIPRPSARVSQSLPMAEPSQLHSRNSRPPQSPKSRTSVEPLTRASSISARPISDLPSYHHSPSEGKAAARQFITSLAGSSLLISPSHPYSSDQVVYSKPAVRGGRHIEVEDEDEDLICPFAVDDDEAEGFRSRSWLLEPLSVSLCFNKIYLRLRFCDWDCVVGEVQEYAEKYCLVPTACRSPELSSF